MSIQARPALSSSERSEWQEFSSFLAHEVRGPLSVILGNAHLLQRVGSCDEQTRESLEDIREEAEKLRRITEGLLALFGEHLESEPMSTRNVINGVVELFHKQHPARPIRLAADTDSCTIGVQSYLEEIVENLLNNADKYSPPGEPIDVEIRNSGFEITISVDDNGEGIGPADAERIFSLFARLDHTVAIPGHGIGLALSRRLAEEMDGDLTYEARPEGGSRFSLRLPSEETQILTAV